MLHSHRFVHDLAHHLDRALEVESLTWTHIQLQCHGIQFLLAVSRQVRALGQILADQAIDILIAAALPGAVRVAEVDRHAGLLGDFSMPRHLPPLFVGHALAHSQRHAIERRAEALHRRGRRRVVHLDQHQVAAGALHQGADRRGVGLALNQVTFPMPRRQPVFDLRRAYVDADHLGNLTAPIRQSAAGGPSCLGAAR